MDKTNDSNRHKDTQDLIDLAEDAMSQTASGAADHQDSLLLKMIAAKSDLDKPRQ